MKTFWHGVAFKFVREGLGNGQRKVLGALLHHTDGLIALEDEIAGALHDQAHDGDEGAWTVLLGNHGVAKDFLEADSPKDVVYVATLIEAHVDHDTFIGVWKTLEEAFNGINNSPVYYDQVVSASYPWLYENNEDLILIEEHVL